jgi:hypothetical protein
VQNSQNLSTDDIISGDGIRNCERASKPFIILSNLFSCNIPSNLFIELQRRLAPFTQANRGIITSSDFLDKLEQKRTAFAFPEFKTTIMEPMSLDISNQNE